MSNVKIAAAVALALSGISAAQAALPTTAACAATTNDIYIAGSSAVQSALFTALAAGPFAANGPPAYYKSSSNGNFQMLCGFDASNALVAVHYRAEGGSVVGALPLITPAHAIRFLDLTATGLPAAVAFPGFATIPVAGSSAVNGTNDSWGPANTIQHLVDVGITDIEPSQFANANYPAAYDHAVFGGGASSANFTSLTTTALVDQVFGIFVNTSGFNGNAATGQAVNLTRETVANILDGTITDWSQVPSATGGVVSTTSENIVLVNREAGSGTRTQASIYFLDYGCSQTNRPVVNNPVSPAPAFATADALAAANTPGGMTYAGIDNNTAAKAPGLTLASISSVIPTNLKATSGEYDDWYEARMIRSGTTVPASALAIYTYMLGTLPAVAHAPQAASILATPNVAGNTTAVPVVAVGATPIYINPFGRSGNSCNAPKKL
jgi:ABC-type phosphate transport system substrate-binding protein